MMNNMIIIFPQFHGILYANAANTNPVYAHSSMIIYHR